MRLTRRGWTLALMVLAFLVAGRLFGLVELVVMGVVGLALLGLALAGIALTRLRLDVHRDIHPPRVYSGAASRVDVTIRNRARRRTPVLRLEDAVQGTSGAELLVGPLEPGTSTAATYRLPTARRGIVDVGPLDVVVTDPFDLATTRTRAADIAELTVYPKVDRIHPPPHTTADDPHAGAEHPNALGRTGEDFYALRPYVVGDDLRRVHWGATAHHDALMVRQDELPWQGRVTVLVDIRHETTTAESFELAVSAAASIVTASWKRRDLIRMVATDGSDWGHAASQGHVDGIMEHLATVSAVGSGAFRQTVETVAQSGAGGAFVALVSEIPDVELDSLLRLDARFGWISVVRFEPSSYGPAWPSPPAADRHGLLRVTNERPFDRVWDAAVSRLPSLRGTRTSPLLANPGHGPTP